MEAGQEMLLAQVLSPSQVSQFLNCPAKWMFRYLLDLKERGTAATALGKTVSLIQKSFFINEKDRHYAETIYPMVQDSIREGIFLPRRSSPLCSRFCGFWNVCEKEYGGSVRCD